MSEPTLFDQSDTHPAEAAYYAEIAVHKNWASAAESAMKYLASTGRPFSADDLRELLRDAGEPATPNAYGGLFMSWSRAGLIARNGGGGQSRQPKRRGSHRYEWVGVRTENVA